MTLFSRSGEHEIGGLDWITSYVLNLLESRLELVDLVKISGEW